MMRTKNGYMLINEKKHCVYDGVNIIGRQKGATVIIPDTSVSHYHSTVVIIEGRHYLSDISSSNGTYLGELRLSPLKLYELDTGNTLRFGLVKATYFKFANSTNSSLEGEASQPSQFDENIFNAGTQVYDIGQTDKESDIVGKSHNNNSQKLIPNLQTDLFGGQNDEELELVAGEIENSFNLDEISGKPSTPTKNILINDLPTQIICSPNGNESTEESTISGQDKSTAINHIPIHDLPTQIILSPGEETEKEENKKENTSISTTSIHNLPTQLISERENETQNVMTEEDINGNPTNDISFHSMPTQLTLPQDDVDSSLTDVSNIDHTSTNIIEETITANSVVEDDQDSRESTDFLTMQPAVTQHFDSDTQSQLFIANLKKRVKNVLNSSDDDSCNLNTNSNKNSQTKKPTLVRSKSSDEETECELSQIKMKKLRKTRAVFDTDSDDSTDADEACITAGNKMVVANNINESQDDGSSTDSDLDIPLEGKLTTTGPTSKDHKMFDDDDDPDIIPTTQTEAPETSSATATVSKSTQESKIGFQPPHHDNNFEASLEESFSLHLTNTQETNTECSKGALSKDIELVEKPPTNTANDSVDIFIGDMEKPKTSDEDKNNHTKNEEHDVDDIPQTQLEVIFDDSNLPEEKNDVRPGNPLINVLDTSSSVSSDSVEDKLARMFQSQVVPALIDKDTFLQPKQVPEQITSVASTVKDDGIFLVPTQIVTNKTQDVPSKNSMKTLEAHADDKATNSDDEDIFLQATQIMPSVYQNSDVSAETKLTTEKDEDIFLQPTQVMCTTPSKTSLKDSEATEKPSDDVFLQPTQILSNDKNLNTVSKSNTATTDSKNVNKDDVADDIFLQRTQVVPIDKEHNMSSESGITNTDSTNVTTYIADDVFLQPTQVLGDGRQLNTISESTSAKSDTENTEKGISSDDIFLKPTQVIPSDSIIVLSENNTVPKEIEQTEQTNNDEIFLKTARDINSKSDKLTNFLNYIAAQSSDSDDIEEVENDSNLKKRSKSPHGTKTRKAVQKSSKRTETRVSKRTAKNQQDAESKGVKISEETGGKSVKSKQNQSAKTKQPPLQSDSDSTDIEDDIDNDKSSPNLLLHTTEKSTSSHASSEESDISTKRRNTKKKENKPTTEDNVIENKAVTIRRSSRKSPMIEITPNKKSSQQLTKPIHNIIDEEATSSEPKVNDKNKLSKSRNKKDKTENITSDHESESSKVALTDNTAKPIVEKTECHVGPSSESLLGGRKTKFAVNEDNLTTKKKKTEDSPAPVATRHSTRRKSTEEKTTNAIKTRTNLNIINEINTPPEQGGTTSEDEFMQTNRATPSKTRNRLKQIPLNKNQRTRESETGNKRGKPNQRDMSEVNLENSNEPLPSSSGANSNSAEGSDTNKTEKETANTVSSTRHSKRFQSEMELKNDAFQQELEHKATASTRRTRKTKADDKEEPPSNTNKTESAILADTPKRMKNVAKHQQRLSKEENPSSPVMLARRSRKFKTDEIEVEQLSGENESSGSSSATSNSRKRRSLSKTSEDDFQLSKVQKRTSSTATVPPTPERTKRLLKPKVIFTMLDSPQLETIIRSLGGFVVDSIELSTVLVTGNVKRSQKLLSAVGLAKPICSPRWLHESKKANHFLDPWDYILEDEEAETKWNFSLKESLRRSSTNKLLKNYTFQIIVNTAQDVLKGSIESCGGKCVTRAPAKNQQTNFVIVAGPENKSKYARLLKQNPPPQIIAPEAIFDGVLRQELHFENHLLS